MSEQPGPEMNEERLRDVARGLAYPPTPDVAGQVRRRLQGAAPGAGPGPGRSRRAVWVALGLIVLILGAAAFAVPEVRAWAQSILRLGSVEIIATTPTPQPGAGTITPPTSTATTLSSFLDLPGETTLEDARARVRYPILLPAYPPDLGPPDKVYVQDLDGLAVILVWLDPQDHTRPAVSLSLLPSDAMARKWTDTTITTLAHTQVNGDDAVWLRGPHVLRFYDAQGREDLGPHYLVVGNVLIWEAGGITYRFESNLTLEEAVRAAESLR